MIRHRAPVAPTEDALADSFRIARHPAQCGSRAELGKLRADFVLSSAFLGHAPRFPYNSIALIADSKLRTKGEGSAELQSMATRQVEPSIDEYLRKRLMPVEGTIPQLAGIDMYGNSIPAGPVGGDLFEYINFQQRYNIDARIARALKLSKEYLEPVLKGQTLRNSVDAHVEWLQSKPGYTDAVAAEYRRAKRSEQLRIAEDLQELHTTAGVLLVDAQGHGIISARSRQPYTTPFMPSCFRNWIGTEKQHQICSRRSICGSPSPSPHATLWVGIRMTIRAKSRPCSMVRY